MNNFFLILKLKNYQKKIFKIISVVFYYLIIFFSLGLFFSGEKYLSLIGFWLFTIFLLDLIIFKSLPIKKLNFERYPKPEDYLDNYLKIAILEAILEAKTISQIDICLLDQILNFKEVRYLFQDLDINPKIISLEIYNLLKEINRGRNLDFETNKGYLIYKNLESILLNSYQLALSFFSTKINSFCFLLSILEKNNPLINNLLNKFRINPLDVYSAFFLKKRFSKKFFWGHENELNQILNLDSKQIRIILTGPLASGKKSLIERLAYLIKKNNVPEEYLNKKIIPINLRELYNQNPSNFKDNLHSIFLQASHNYLQEIVFIYDPPSFLIPIIIDEVEIFLKNTNLNIIFSLISENFYKFDKIKNFFKIINFRDFNEKEVVVILALEIKSKIKTQVFIQPRALTKIVTLAKNYFINQPLINASRWLLQESISFCEKNNLRVLTEEIVGDVFSKISNLSKFDYYKKNLLDDLETIFHQKLINQDLAIKKVIKALMFFEKIISFLFIGTTGVGKKKLAKCLADIYFGGEENIIYLDLSQFNNKLLLDEKEINFEDWLFSEVKKKPYSLLLIDNFNQNNKRILENLAFILKNGYLRNSKGEIVEFKKNIFVVISNILSEVIEKEIKIGKSLKIIERKIKDYFWEKFNLDLEKIFSEIIIFTPLSQADKETFLERLITDANLKTLRDYNLQINFTQTVKNYFSQLPLSDLEIKFKEEILDKIINYQNNKKIIKVDYVDNKIIFT